VCRLAEAKYPRDWTGYDGPRTGEFAEFHSILSTVALDAVTADPGLVPSSRSALTATPPSVIGSSSGSRRRSKPIFRRVGKVPVNLVALRCCLFAAQRGFHHRGETMEGPYVALFSLQFTDTFEFEGTGASVVGQRGRGLERDRRVEPACVACV
jgi:hypothetical protein